MPALRAALLLALTPVCHAQFGALAELGATEVATTPLDEYVAKEDPAFRWEVVGRAEQPTHRELFIDFTSQTWRTEEEVSRPKWRHRLTIVVPNGVEAETALLFITGGTHLAKQELNAGGRFTRAAIATRSVVATLYQVPNQPIRVLGSDDPERGRFEDDLLAASWKRFMATEDPTWIAQLPMAKSAVAAMDVVQAALAEEEDAPTINQFTVAGASKRGWTTWLAAAVDDRVAAIAPIVIDVLNIEPSMKHHFASYGAWSRALQDYERQGLADSLSSPQSAVIRAIVDPYAYRDRLTMPKCLINASGDEFFLPDSSRFYFDDLVGEKHLSYTPNTGHSLKGSSALDTLVAFHASVAHGLPRPTLSWDPVVDTRELVAGGQTGVAVRCSTQPVEAVLWRAVNPGARDFRHPIVGDAFKPTPLEPEAIGSYFAPLEAPEKGYAATFVRFTFDIGAAKPFRISTPVWVTPDVEPFAEKD